MNTYNTIIVMGRSGSGKGTQINLLKEYLQEQLNKSVYHFESGSLFRGMIKGDGYTSERLREILKRGELVPDFFTDWLLINGFVENLVDENQILILDGYPRTIPQTETLEKALRYYGREKALVIHVDVSEEEVRRRMLERGRGDDVNMDAVNNRIKFFNEEVLPSIETLRNHENYTVVDINGEGSVEDIQENIKGLITK